MNIRKNGIDKSMNSKDDEGALEKIAKKIAPPSREVSDAQLIDPGANTPETTPNRPSKSPGPRRETRTRPSQIKR